jgi:gamma-glutamyltranspeptidase / glutathione hydrolase
VREFARVFTTRPELRGSFGMVASTHWLASASGMAVLEQGGNAFDAAVAAGLVLQVVEPHMNGPAGDVPALVWSAGRGEPLVLCGQGVAPAAATIELLRGELGVELIPGNGFLPAVVPGAFDAWMLMLRDLGTLGLADVFRFAVGYAEDGYPLAAGAVEEIRGLEPLFREAWPTSAELYLPVRRPLERFRNRPLAATWRRLVGEAEAAARDREGRIEAARRIWREGFVGEALVRFAQETEALDASGRRHRGLLTGDDLAGWSASWEQPLAVDYAGHTVLKAGPWSQAPVFLQQLRLLEGLDLAALGLGSPAYLHTVVECAKLAFSDREAWYGDPAFAGVPVEELLSREYADERRTLVGDAAAAELRPGSPGGREPRLPRIPDAPSAAGLGDPTRRTGDTCHVDVADRLGNLVSATPSGGWLSGSPVVPELGFCLGTRGQMFWLEDGLPNSLAPGKRPRTTLSPTLVLRGGDPYLALGTPGGDQQDQWSLHVFLAHAAFGLDLQAAIDAPNFHTEAFPSSFYPRETRPRHVAVESRLAGAGELRRRGHEVEVAEAWSLGRVSAAGREPDGTLKAAANPRGMQGYAVGR